MTQSPSAGTHASAHRHPVPLRHTQRLTLTHTAHAPPAHAHATDKWHRHTDCHTFSQRHAHARPCSHTRTQGPGLSSGQGRWTLPTSEHRARPRGQRRRPPARGAREPPAAGGRGRGLGAGGRRASQAWVESRSRRRLRRLRPEIRHLAPAPADKARGRAGALPRRAGRSPFVPEPPGAASASPTRSVAGALRLYFRKSHSIRSKCDRTYSNRCLQSPPLRGTGCGRRVSRFPDPQRRPSPSHASCQMFDFSMNSPRN